MDSSTTKKFFIPLWVGWLINILSWVLFLATDENEIEILAGVLCLLAIFIGVKHKNSRLIITSILEALWMFSFGTDAVDGDVLGDLTKSIKRML
jgi:hypothetical protein